MILRRTDAAFIPDFLRPYQSESIETDDGYKQLCRRLTNQPEILKPGLGTPRSLPPRKPNKAALKVKPDDLQSAPVPENPRGPSEQHVRPKLVASMLRWSSLALTIAMAGAVAAVWLRSQLLETKELATTTLTAVTGGETFPFVRLSDSESGYQTAYLFAPLRDDIFFRLDAVDKEGADRSRGSNGPFGLTTPVNLSDVAVDVSPAILEAGGFSNFLFRKRWPRISPDTINSFSSSLTIGHVTLPMRDRILFRMVLSALNGTWNEAVAICKTPQGSWAVRYVVVGHFSTTKRSGTLLDRATEGYPSACKVDLFPESQGDLLFGPIKTCKSTDDECF